jgi:hypothetical protein
MPSSKVTSALDGLRGRLDSVESRVERRYQKVDVVTFAERDLGLKLDDWQRDVLGGDWKRALLNITRQGGKSTTAAVLGLFEALYRPGSLTLIVSPSDRQSGELYRKLAALRDLLPQSFELLEDTKRSMSVRGGGRVASLPGSEATIRGFSAATLIVEDEASRVEDELYLSVRPMLATTNGRLLLMSTPFGRRGHFWEEWSEGGDGWKRVEVPASSIPRISAGFLEEEKQALGSWWYAQEYECKFTASDDQFFRHEDIQAALSDTVKPFFPTIGAQP